MYMYMYMYSLVQYTSSTGEVSNIQYSIHTIYRLDTETMGSMGFRNPKALGCGAEHSEGATKGLRVSKYHRSCWSSMSN